jgi:serine/threonine-protein kinase
MDDSGDYLTEGLTEEIIDRLAQVQTLKVTAFSSVFQLRDKRIDLPELGRILDVDDLLTVRILSEEPVVSISVELVDADDGSRKWGKQYSWYERELVSVSAQIAEEVAGVLNVELNPEVRRFLIRPFTKDAQAYRLFLQGQQYWYQFTGEALEKSLFYYQKAVEQDPGYALAYAAQADSYNVLGIMGRQRPAEVFPNAEQCALRALTIDGMLPEAFVSLGAFKLFYEWKWSEAEKLLKRAVELKPSYAQSLELNTRYGDSRHYYCYLLDSSGKLDESINEIKTALNLDPLSQTLQAELGFSYLFSGRVQKARTQLEKTLELHPSFVFASVGRARALVQQGHFHEAVRELQKARRIAPGWPQLEGELGYAFGKAGNKTKAVGLIKQLYQQAEHGYVDPFHFAVAHLGIGEESTAVEWLGKAYEQRSPLMIWLKVDPRFDPLRARPDFKSLIGQIWKSPSLSSFCKGDQPQVRPQPG